MAYYWDDGAEENLPLHEDALLQLTLQPVQDLLPHDYYNGTAMRYQRYPEAAVVTRHQQPLGFER